MNEQSRPAQANAAASEEIISLDPRADENLMRQSTGA